VNEQGDVMKKQLAIALGLAVVSVPAMASKARLESLGQGANGSQYIDDNRNVFLNAATLNQHKDFVTIEVGANDAALDAEATPRMEGGLFKSSGSMVYGLYFGHENDAANAGRALNGLPGEQNNFSLFFAGDAGVQWGAALTYGSYKKESPDPDTGNDDDIETGNMAAKLGVISGDIEAFLNLGLSNTAEVKGGAEYTGTGSIDLGLTYGMGDASVYFRYETSSAENADDAVSRNAMTLGYARQYKLNDKANLWVDARYTQESRECEGLFQGFSVGGNDYKGVCGSVGGDELTTTGLPVTVSLEVSAKDWLTLRGFISQEVLISTTSGGDDTDSQAEGNRKHGVGASLVFDDLTIDGSLILSNSTQAGVLNIDEPMSRVSLNYNF
jgi:hypothetical protein